MKVNCSVVLKYLPVPEMQVDRKSDVNMCSWSQAYLTARVLPNRVFRLMPSKFLLQIFFDFSQSQSQCDHEGNQRK